MKPSPSHQNLRQYADGELPADMLAEYPVAKQPQLEAPHFGQPVRVTIPREVQQQNRRQRRTMMFTFLFWTL